MDMMYTEDVCRGCPNRIRYGNDGYDCSDPNGDPEECVKYKKDIQIFLAKIKGEN